MVEKHLQIYLKDLLKIFVQKIRNLNVYFKSLISSRFKSDLNLKDALSCLRQFLASESSLKMTNNAFYFTLKALFVLKIFKFIA